MTGYERNIPTTFALTIVGTAGAGAIDVTAPVGADIVVMGSTIVAIGDPAAKTETRHLFGTQPGGTVPSTATLRGIADTDSFIIFEL